MAVEVTSGGIQNVAGDLTPAENRHLKAMEARITRGMHTFREVGAALADIRDNRLYRQTHPTFEAYCRDRWDMARDRAYQLIGAAEVVKVIGGDEKEGPVNEAQAKELVVVAHNHGPEVVKAVWTDVKASGKPLTAAAVREAVRARVEPEAPAGPTPTEALTNSVVALVARYQRWLTTKPSRKEKAVVTAAFERLWEVVPQPA